MELRCPDCCSPEVLPDPRKSPGARRCGNCNARFHRDSALVTVTDAESRRSEKGPAPHPLFGLDRDAAAKALSDPGGVIEPITPFSDADELHGLFESALGAEVITYDFESAYIAIYPMSTANPQPLPAVEIGGGVVFMGSAVNLRIKSIIGAVSSLYRWALSLEKATHNPAEDVHLPANDSKEIDRISPPGEFAHLLDQLAPEDALPWALAGYGTARAEEIRALEWPEIDFELDVMLLAGSDEARKSEAARRVVPLVKPLGERLYAEWIRQGLPSTGRVCPPRRKSPSGMLSVNQLQKRIVKIWEGLGLDPIRLQESRHSAATWLDHAHVSPKVASVFMGHKAPKRQPDAAPITLRRYTHILPGELERARDQLDAFLAERAVEEEGASFKLAVAA